MTAQVRVANPSSMAWSTFRRSERSPRMARSSYLVSPLRARATPGNKPMSAIPVNAVTTATRIRGQNS